MMRMLDLALATAVVASFAPAHAAVIYEATADSGNGFSDILDDFNNPIVGQTGSIWATISAGSFSYAEWRLRGEQQILWWEDIGEEDPFFTGNEYTFEPECSVTPGAPSCGVPDFSVMLLAPKLLRIDFVRPVEYNFCFPFPGYGDCAVSYDIPGASLYFIAESDVTTTFRLHDTNPVPEPAAWAMLIAGFGLVGAMQRRRRKTVTA